MRPRPTAESPATFTTSSEGALIFDYNASPRTRPMGLGLDLWAGKARSFRSRSASAQPLLVAALVSWSSFREVTAHRASEHAARERTLLDYEDRTGFALEHSVIAHLDAAGTQIQSVLESGVVLELATCGTTPRSHHVLEEGSPVDLRPFNTKSECVRSHGTILTGQCRLGNRETILAACHQGAVVATGDKRRSPGALGEGLGEVIENLGKPRLDLCVRRPRRIVATCRAGP